MKNLIPIFGGLFVLLTPLSASAFTLAGVSDQGAGDICNGLDEVGIICLLLEETDNLGNVLTRTTLTGTGTVTDNSAKINIKGAIQNFTENRVDLTRVSTLDYGTNANPLPAKGIIWADLDAHLRSNDPNFNLSQGYEQVTVTTNATTFVPNTVSAQDTAVAGLEIFTGDQEIVFDDYQFKKGELINNTGVLTVTYNVSLGPKQILGFGNTFVGAFKVPEPSSTFGLFLFATLGTSSLYKRKHKV